MLYGQNYIAYFWENTVETVNRYGEIIRIKLNEKEAEHWKQGEFEQIEGYEKLIKLGVLGENKSAPLLYLKPNWDRIQIEITEACNLNCKHCYLGDKKPKHMDIKTFTCILQTCKDKGVKVIEYSGGEPLLHPEFEKFVSLGKEMGFFQMLFTNGMLRANPKYFDIIQVSIDGTKEHHEKIRGKEGIFEKILENLEFYKKHTQTIVSTIVFKETTLKELLKLGDIIGTTHRIAPPVPCGYSQYGIQELRECYATCVEYASKKGIKIKNRFQCNAGRRFFYFDVEGNLHPCPLLKDVEINTWLKHLEKYEKICNTCEGCFIPCPAYRYYLNTNVNPWCKNQFLPSQDD